ncbi:hypothetical protein CR513_62891, partial [Mucuna pruriens]
MAIPKQPPMTLLLFALITLSLATTSNAVDCVGAGAISVYWGQKSEATEGTLESVCASENYNIVILESLLVYDDGTTPVLNLAGHCGSDTYPCSKLQPQIEYCQKNKIKVFLSIGQDEIVKARNRHSKSDPTSAEQLASYLLENYLSGQPGPLGNVSLDGIDIADVADGENLKWAEVVKAINASTSARKIYLSASPQCVYPDYYLGNAISTGLFDYIWVEFFYQNPCIYANNDASNLLKEWSKWTKHVPKSSIFLGLVASHDIAGYISPEALISKVLPTVKKASKSNYTAQIKGNITKNCRCVCDGDAFASNGFYGLGSASLRLSA